MYSLNVSYSINILIVLDEWTDGPEFIEPCRKGGGEQKNMI